MNPMERGIDPTEAFLSLQQVVSGEVSRLLLEIAMRDAYIKQLEEHIAQNDEENQEQK